MSKLEYRPEIDGLRAIAVGVVVLYHAGTPLIHGGFVGVDVFFVISGYLITSILYREMTEARFSLITFYERRARRLLPALFTVVIVTFLVSWFVLLPNDLADLGKSAIWVMFFSSNIFFWNQSENYFNAPAELKPLLHTWSLGVEEQFYILFPALLFILIRMTRFRLLSSAIILGFLVSFGLSVWGVANTPVAAFYFLPTRAWELLTGSLLALPLIPLLRSTPLREIAATVGLALIVLSVFFVTSATPFPGLAALPSCLGTALIIYANRGVQTRVGQWLSFGPVVFVGQISYSLYLVHWPIFVLYGYVAIHELTAGDVFVCLVGSFVLATLCWHYVERPFRTRAAAGIERKQIFVGTALGMLLVTGGGLALILTDGAPGRIPNEILAVLEPKQYLGADRRCHKVRTKSTTEICQLGDPAAPVSFILVGDSHGGAMAPGIFSAAAKAGKAGLQFTEDTYVPVFGYEKWGEQEKFRILNKRLHDLLEARPDITEILIVIYWKLATEGNRYWNETGELLEGKVAAADGLHRFAMAFPDRKFVIVQAPPVSPMFGYHTQSRKMLFGGSIRQDVTRAQYLEMRSHYEGALARLAALANVSTIDPVDIYCTGEICPGALDGKLLYRDDNHLSAFGSERLVPLFLKHWAAEGR